MSDTLTIAGSTIDLIATNTQIDLLIPHRKGAYPELHFTRLLGAPGTLPDPWNGAAVSLVMGAVGTSPVFAGDVVGFVDTYLDQVGWAREYRALGLINRAEHIPVTDAVTLTDTSAWNLPADDPAYVASRAGQTVGQIIQAILTMGVNASPLSAAGIGAYTSSSPWTLPSATLADLATLTVIPPWRASIAGERLLSAIEQFLQTCHPNHWCHVQPDGTIRFLDLRTYAASTLTLGADPRLDMPSLSRDIADCYSRVLVRGFTQVQGMAVQTQPWPGSSLADGGLAEDFAHDGLTDAAAKSAWQPSDWSQPNQGVGAPLARGTCTCPDTTHVTINTTLTLAADALAQGAGELRAVVLLAADSLAGQVTQFFQARVISNTATAAGSCTLQLDAPMPAPVYGSYQLFALNAGANAVGRRYRLTNAALASAIQTQFPYPVPFVTSTGEAAAMVSTPMAVVEYSATGSASPPYNAAPIGVTCDPAAGLVYLDMPSQVVAYGLNTPVRWPANVLVFLPIATGTLQAWAPSSTTDAGTMHAVEGIRRTKTISIPEWRDYSNQSSMNQFASEFLDAVKDAVIEGTATYHGLLTAQVAPGQSVQFAGSGYAVPWGGTAIPVVGAEIHFNNGPAGTSYTTVLQLSSRRGRYNAESFLRPGITGLALGTDQVDSGGFGTSRAESWRQSAQLAQGSRDLTRDATRGPVGFEGDRLAQQQAQRQQAFRERYDNDDEFRHAVDRQHRQAMQQAAIDSNPWASMQQQMGMMGGRMAEGFGQLDVMANVDPGAMANAGLRDLGIDLGLDDPGRGQGPGPNPGGEAD
jgi:hypothetical protein